MKADERRRLERRLSFWRRTLGTLNDIGPESEALEDMEGFGEVKDYILDQIDGLETVLTKAARDRMEKRGRKLPSLRPRANGLHPRDNAPHNGVTGGPDNG